MTKRCLDEATGGHGVSPCTYSVGLGAHETLEHMDIMAKVARWLNELVRHYDALEWTVTAAGLQRSSAFPVTAFHGRPLPICIEQFLGRFKAQLKDFDMVILAAAVYLSRIVERANALPVSSCTIHRILVAALTVAQKFVLDKPKSNKVMAILAGIPLKELNQMEVKFLCGIEYALTVSPADINTANEALEMRDFDPSAVEEALATSGHVEDMARMDETLNVGEEDSDASDVTVGGAEDDIATNNYDARMEEMEERSTKRRRVESTESVLTGNNYEDDASPSSWCGTVSSCGEACVHESSMTLKELVDSSSAKVSTTKVSTPDRRGNITMCPVAAE